MTLQDLLRASAPPPSAVLQNVDGLRGEGLSECLALGLPEQRRLWQIAEAECSEIRGELVAGATAVFAGRNTLPLLSRFEKWFAHHEGALFGCNRHPLAPLIGPGYFEVRPAADGHLEFDYGSLPSTSPPGWPAVRPNTSWPARAVYGGLLDRVLWLSADVLVGAAFRDGAPLDSYFVLVRRP